MNTPRKTKLYNEIAKDFSPKRADMMICQYIEMLEGRIEALEKCCKVLEQLMEDTGKPAAEGAGKPSAAGTPKNKKGDS